MDLFVYTSSEPNMQNVAGDEIIINFSVLLGMRTRVRDFARRKSSRRCAAAPFLKTNKLTFCVNSPRFSLWSGRRFCWTFPSEERFRSSSPVFHFSVSIPKVVTFLNKRGHFDWRLFDCGGHIWQPRATVKSKQAVAAAAVDWLLVTHSSNRKFNVSNSPASLLNKTPHQCSNPNERRRRLFFKVIILHLRFLPDWFVNNSNVPNYTVIGVGVCTRICVYKRPSSALLALVLHHAELFWLGSSTFVTGCLSFLSSSSSAAVSWIV